MAVLLAEHIVELVVPGLEERGCGQGKREMWPRARDEAWAMLKEAGAVGLPLGRKEAVAVRLVERGKERFFDLGE